MTNMMYTIDHLYFLRFTINTNTNICDADSYTVIDC